MEEHTMTEAILQLKKLVDESDNIVFFGGAGVSTESGIKDFRSVDGLYHQKFKYPPETRPQRAATGKRARTAILSTPCTKLWAKAASLPRTWAT